MKRGATRYALVCSLVFASSILVFPLPIAAATPDPPAWRNVSLDSDEPIHEVRIEPTGGNPWILLGNNTIRQRRADGTWAEPLRVEANRIVSSLHVVRPGLIYVSSLHSDADSAPGVEIHRGGRWSPVGRFDKCLRPIRLEGRDGTVAAGGRPQRAGVARRLMAHVR